MKPAIAWAVWVTFTLAAAGVVAYAATATFLPPEAAIVAFGFGMAWSAALPRILRAISRIGR